MQHGTSSDSATLTEPKRLSDKRESEFNHRLSGFLLFLAGIFLLAEIRLAQRWPSLRYSWPICFLMTGLFVLVFSDTEIWPFGNQSFLYAITHNLEDLQHKLFALLLLGLGIVEFQAIRGRWTAWSACIFPLGAATGAVLLLFHYHDGAAHGPDAMAVMERVRFQHAWYAVLGVAIAVTKGYSARRVKWQSIFARAWPSLLIVLGVSLMLYTE